MKQNTIKKEIKIAGRGIHSNQAVNITIKPADENTGIIFRRVDFDQPIDIPARVDNIIAEKALRQTTLTSGNASVKTVEHLLAAIYASGITNTVIEIDQEELPALDGGAQGFWDAIKEVGVSQQSQEAPEITIKDPIYFTGKSHASMIALPSDEFRISYTLSYDSEDLGDEFFDVTVNEKTFDEDLAGARTFCLREEAEQLRALGFGKGADFSNTLVYEKKSPMNNELRYSNEAVRHKIVDLIGDLSLLGVRLKAHIIAFKSGHSLNIEMVRALKKLVETQSSQITNVQAIEKENIDINEIQKILPHRYPFLLVDRVIKLTPREKAIAIKNVTINEPFFQGHFPGHPVMPGVLIVEAMAQVAGIIMLNVPENLGKLAYFMCIDNAKFRHPVLPGDQLRFEVEVMKFRSKFGQAIGKAYVGDTLACEALLKFSILHKED